MIDARGIDSDWQKDCSDDPDCYRDIAGWFDYLEEQEGKRLLAERSKADRERMIALREELGESAERHGSRVNNWKRLGIVDPPDQLRYYEMLKAANGHCPLCGRPTGSRNLQLHHNHKTGKVVGLLCSRCNMGMGQFEDDPELLELAAEYLRTFH